jgi:hypothetical protein
MTVVSFYSKRQLPCAAQKQQLSIQWPLEPAGTQTQLGNLGDIQFSFHTHGAWTYVCKHTHTHTHTHVLTPRHTNMLTHTKTPTCTSIHTLSRCTLKYTHMFARMQPLHTVTIHTHAYVNTQHIPSLVCTCSSHMHNHNALSHMIMMHACTLTHIRYTHAHSQTYMCTCTTLTHIVSHSPTLKVGKSGIIKTLVMPEPPPSPPWDLPFRGASSPGVTLVASHSLSMATSLTPVCQVKSPGADKVPLVNSWGSVAHHSPLRDCGYGRWQGSRLSPVLPVCVCLCA